MTKKKNRGLRDFYVELWNTRPHYSQLSGKWLGNELSSVFCAHILEKRTYPEQMLDPDNIIFLTADEHQKFDSWREQRLIDLGGNWPKLLKQKEKMKEEYMENFGSKLKRNPGD